jgi:hypothetical protein
MNWMTSGRHRALGTRNARKKQLQLQLPEHVQRVSDRRRLQVQQRHIGSSCSSSQLPLPRGMQLVDPAGEKTSNDKKNDRESGTPWYILSVNDDDESQGE